MLSLLTEGPSAAAAHILLAHGAGSTFSLTALARRLDPSDPLDPAQVAAEVEQVTDILVSGLTLAP